MTTPAVGTVTPLADTARPPLILTPDLNSAPNEATLTLLGEMVKYHLDSEEVYTITNCDYVSPEGPNFLFTIKQYYWEVEPGRWGTYPLLIFCIEADVQRLGMAIRTGVCQLTRITVMG